MELAPVDSTGAAGFLGRGSHFSPECPRETSGSPTTLGPPLPSRRGFRSEHRASKPYLDRTRHRTGMAYPGGALVTAFAAQGWGWGGLWAGAKDYQHFSANGH